MTAPIFRDLGGIFQLHIATPEDLERIESLDKARWAATSAPVGDFLCDPAFLSMVDTDKDGRIRLLEVRAARRWLWERLRNRDRLAQASDVLNLSDLDPSYGGTAKLTSLATHLLEQAGASRTDAVDLAQVRAYRAEYVKQFPNGDGIVTAPHAGDDALAAAISDIVAATGGSLDATGDQGASVANLDAYLEKAAAFVAWKARLADEAATIVPLGDDTAAAAALVDSLAAKLDQFFAQCALLALEEKAGAVLAATEEELGALDTDDPAAIQAWLAGAPVARPNPDGVLDFEGPLNAHYAAELSKLAQDVGPRLLGTLGKLASLDVTTWKTLRGAVAPYRAWVGAGPAGIAADADPAALQAFIDGPLPDQLRARCAEDQSVAGEIAALHELEQVILYQRWLMEFANNFVSFPRLFSDDDRAMFQKGVLIMDGRKMNLAVRVADKGAHKKLAEQSLMFLAYLDLVRTEGGAGQTDSVVVAVTNGVRGGIGVGKRGVFYDHLDREWDAIVTDVIAQPISLWEAIIAPFVRARDAIADRIKKAAESKAASAEGDLGKTTDAAAQGQVPGQKAEAAPADSGGASNMQNMLIGGTVALAAGASALAFIVNTVANIDPMSAVLAIVVLIAVIAAIFGFLGWLKLRKRDLSTLLEAGGWAMNGRMRLSQYMAERFTERPGLPSGAVRRRDTPMPGWQKVIIGVVVVVFALVVTYLLKPEWFDLLVI